MKLIGYSNQGPIRSSNQDNFWAAEFEGDSCIAVIADGMGGLARGEEASSIVCRNIKAISEISTDIEDLEKSLHSSNEEILALSKGERMGTTVTLLKIEGSQFTILHAGDTRCYGLYKGVAEVITEDQTAYSLFKKQGKWVLPHEEAKLRSRLTNCLGVKAIVSLERYSGYAEKGSRFLLASDGFWHLLQDEDLIKLGTAKVEESLLVDLVRRFIRERESDNQTAILIEL